MRKKPKTVNPKNRMEQTVKKTTTTAYVIDLTQIEGDGDFLCPSCGTLISPEDESETSYTIQEVKMQRDEQLQELTVKCKRCGSTIHLTGFTTL
jgi:predicted RNA-binding Zn-ribbon protein involved in translation (DUF1610 family)